MDKRHLKAFPLLLSTSTLIMVAANVVLAFAAAPTPNQLQPSAPPKVENQALGNVDIEGLREQMRQIARDEITSRLSGSERGAIDIATAAMKQNDSTMSVVSWASGIAIAIITLITAGGVGALLYGQHGVLAEAEKKIAEAKEKATRAGEEAVAARDRVQKVEEDAKAAAQNVRGFEAATRGALEDVDKYFKDLPALESPVVLGSPPDIPAANEVMQMEEADILTVLAEKIRPPSEGNLSRAFLSLGLYWRQIGVYPRAIARFQSATVLDPQCWEAFEGLARAFIELSARSGITAAAKERLLRSAEEACNQALAKGGKQTKTLCDQAAIADARGEYAEAVELYKEAQSLDPKLERLSAVYNPACIYAAEFKDYKSTLDELKKIIGRDKVRELVAADRDFDGLRQDPEYKKEYENLMNA